MNAILKHLIPPAKEEKKEDKNDKREKDGNMDD